ncbi:hypothetical protein TRIATDRAFT_301097 [Trichoderma atroviride IMI 206040]|uniref:Uncharacterized protein n=1 Tax=Hypocrea atroviridis (strain ATCC 20476 / IMI 206040) TaxID=452589 RepID=G9P0P0_HYPAI|nr:uncharacterized protein TRIATDRAFT_301097 [Trichoderma atroviride IMI 206040]EHK43191.1 hypothetical protein TRIATDRAFT_301097 [Trichoderma atroviride IMI 206040]
MTTSKMLASVRIGRGAICLYLYVLDPPMSRSHKATLSLRDAAELLAVSIVILPVMSYWTPRSQQPVYTCTTIMPFSTMARVLDRQVLLLYSPSYLGVGACKVFNRLPASHLYEYKYQLTRLPT